VPKTQGGRVSAGRRDEPDVARGTQRREMVEQLHRLLRFQLPVDDIRVCYHDAADRCTCRKPLPGMFLEAAGEWQIDLAASFMIGDRWKDIEAGRRAGCRTVFIDYAYAEQRPAEPDAVVRSFPEAVEWIMSAVAGGSKS
jgi:D-glycero-D-manno-heptose 1,7-bisphosphate phosphatase